MKLSKNTTIPNILVEKLLFSGVGLGRMPDGKKILISGGAIPESRVDLRVVREKKDYIEAQILQTVERSPLETDLPAHYQVYGGCRWLPIRYADQLRIKEEQVRDAFRFLGEEAANVVFHPIIASPDIYGYRNKLEFSFGKYISLKEGVHDDFRFGFHQPGTFDRIIDCTHCVLADDAINSIFHEIDTWTRASGLPTYDPKTQEGFYRHLVIRKAHVSGETMVILLPDELARGGGPLSSGAGVRGGGESALRSLRWDGDDRHPPRGQIRGRVECRARAGGIRRWAAQCTRERCLPYPLFLGQDGGLPRTVCPA